ncbi:MAG: TonB-dependent siderophore receptor [Proteobacteria bacterium]|nr:TonB-dependent siderophore receptor [Pseudomonadota bacterium]
MPQSNSSPVIINGERPEADNRVNSLSSLGPLGTTPVLDTPYSISVLPADVIQNSQAVNFKDVSKYLPLVAYQEQQGPDVLRPQTRGMQGSNFQNTKVDGMTMFITVGNALEQFQQIEVVNGVSSSLYGPANPSGMFNFVQKRPTDEPLREVAVSYNSDTIGTARVDLGGKLDPNGIFGYRLNALYGTGDAYVDHSRQRRLLGDLGIDVHAWTGGVIELNYSDYSLEDKGYPGWFTYSETTVLPAAPDPTRVGYGQEYAGVELHNRMGTVRVKQDINSNWRAVAGVLRQDGTRNINTPVNNLTSNTANYTSSFANGFAPRFVITSDTAYLNGNFETGPLAHDLTMGTAGYKAQTYSVRVAASPASVRLGTANIADPIVFPEPANGPPDTSSRFDSSDNYQQGFNIGDTIRFNEYWSARVAASQDWFHTNNFNVKGARTTRYSDSGVSPTGSLIFKPASNMSTYVTYASSLQVGDLAPGMAANGGSSLPPYRSKEYEVGYKATFAKIGFTAALFRIERPFANIDPADKVFKISGEQVNRGLELSSVGEIVDGLTVFGGLTVLDARLQHTALPSTNGQNYVGAARIKGNTLFEYHIPGLPGLVAVFDYQFSGRRAANDTNTQVAAGYNLFDIGARFTSTIGRLPVTLRVAVNNVTDRAYYSTIGPSNLTGTNTGNLLAHLGAPRTVLASLTTDF